MGSFYVVFGLLSLAVGNIILKKSHPPLSSFPEKYDWDERGWEELSFRFIQGLVGLIIFIVGLIVLIVNMAVTISNIL